MSQRIKLPSRDPGVKVELGQGDELTEFKMKPVTIDIEEELNECIRAAADVEANPDSKPIDLAEAEVAQLDIILEPLPRPAGDTKEDRKPSELLIGDVGDETADPPVRPRPGYVTGDVTRAQIQSTVARIISAARPT